MNHMNRHLIVLWFCPLNGYGMRHWYPDHLVFADLMRLAFLGSGSSKAMFGV